MARRLIEVDPHRWASWLDGFAERHGEVVHDGDTHRAADGSVVVADHFDHDLLGVILVRRGGYAVAHVAGAELVRHKIGSRYVQSRTAAGGWSQQRFARRRANQADALVEAVAGHARRIMLCADRDGAAQQPPTGLVVGGDRALVTAVLTEPVLSTLSTLPRREVPGLPDPNRRVLEQAVRRGRAVRLALEETPGTEHPSQTN